MVIDLIDSSTGTSEIVVPPPDGVTGFESVLRLAAESVDASPRLLPTSRRVFAAVDAVARRAGRSTVTGLYTDFEVVGSSQRID